jgi:hypothetical protein
VKASHKRDLALLGAGSLVGLFLGLWLCWPSPCKGHKNDVQTVTAGVREMNADTDRMINELEKELEDGK